MRCAAVFAQAADKAQAQAHGGAGKELESDLPEVRRELTAGSSVQSQSLCVTSGGSTSTPWRLRVLDQLRGGVEAHGLRVEHRGQEAARARGT